MSDLFEGEHNLPQFSRKYKQASDALVAAFSLYQAVAEEEIWRFAPDWAERIDVEWVEDYAVSRLYLRRISGAGHEYDDISHGTEDEGRRWDAIDTLVSGLADSWEAARSSYLRDGSVFYIERPTNEF